MNQSKPQPFLLDLLRRLLKQRPLGAASAVVVLVLAVIAILADILAPFPFAEMHLVDRLGDPSATYLLGTDQLGRDVLSRLVYGARTSLGVGFAATLLSTAGGAAGGRRGRLRRAASWTYWCSASSTPGCPSPACCCC